MPYTSSRVQDSPIILETIQDFYTSIREYYDELFPLKDSVLQFFIKLQKDQQETFTLQPAPLCRFLSIGCATGTLENRLSASSMDITGIDKNPGMIETANRRMKRACSTLRFFEMSALEMNRFLKHGSFNIISCIENTLPYISDETLLRKVFHDAKTLLAPAGKFIVQISNFEQKTNLSTIQLPDRSSVRVTLQRAYIQKEDGSFYLEASLQLGNGQKIVLQRNTKILPVTIQQLEAYSKEAEFVSYSLYSDFSFTPWSEASPEIVMVFNT